MPSYSPPKRATEYIFYVSLVSQANTKLFQNNPTIASGDFQVSKDGGTFANLTTLPTVTPTSSRSVKITLSSTEMTADNVYVRAVDAAGSEWCDQSWLIQPSVRQLDDLAYPAVSGRSTAIDTSGRVDIGSWLGGAVPTPNQTGRPLVDLTHLLGGAVPTPTQTGRPLVDITHFGGVAGTFASGRAEVNTSHFGGTAGTFAAGRPEVNTSHVSGTAQTAGNIMASLGAVTVAAGTGDPDTAKSIMQYTKQLINILIGTDGIATFPAEAAPANAVSLAEVIRAIHADVTGLNGDAMRGTNNALLAASAPTNFGDLAITATTGRVTVGTNLDKTGYSISGTKTTLDALNDLSAAAVNAEVDTALADIHLDHLLATTYDPASKPGVADALLNELVEDDLGVSRFTANALEQAPSAGGGTDWTTAEKEQIRSALGIDGTKTAATGGQLQTIDSIVDSILLDTAEIGTAGAGLTEAGGTGDHLNAIPWNIAWDAEVQSEVQDALEANNLDHLIGTATAIPAVPAGTYLDQIMRTSGGTFDRSTDSLEAIRDRGDAAWITGTAPSAATIADAVLDELLSGHTTAGSLGKAIADIEADTNELQTDNVPGLIASLNNLSAGDVDARLTNFFSTVTYAQPGVGAPPTSPTLVQMLNFMYTGFTHKKVEDANGGEVYANDGTTVLFKYTHTFDTLNKIYTKNAMISG